MCITTANLTFICFNFVQNMSWRICLKMSVVNKRNVKYDCVLQPELWASFLLMIGWLEFRTGTGECLTCDSSWGDLRGWRGAERYLEDALHSLPFFFEHSCPTRGLTLGNLGCYRIFAHIFALPSLIIQSLQSLLRWHKPYLCDFLRHWQNVTS